jgi:hypothetical protein
MSRLYDALRRAEAERERIRKGGPAAAPFAVPEQAPRARRIRLREAPQLPPLVRALLIFASGAALALAAVRIAPRLNPAAQPAAQPAFAASPAGLKLDYRLDLTRKGDAAR